MVPPVRGDVIEKDDASSSKRSSADEHSDSGIKLASSSDIQEGGEAGAKESLESQC